VDLGGGHRQHLRGLPRHRARAGRQREIERFGGYIGQSFTAIAGVAALVMAMAEVDYFWIANAVYLCFALSSADFPGSAR
jgi:hypothetical protein